MNISQVTLADLDVLVPLFDGYRMFYKGESDQDSARKFLYDRIAWQQSIIFIATDDKGEGMGFVQLYPIFSSVSMRRLWLLNDLFVSADHRKQGVGEALMNRARRHAEETGAKGLMLETETNNEKAQRLYERLGYEKNTHHYLYELEI